VAIITCSQEEEFMVKIGLSPEPPKNLHPVAQFWPFQSMFTGKEKNSETRKNKV
jgi:hypothetical protein